MKVFFHERFYEVYAYEPAAAEGRMEAIVRALGKDFEFVSPTPASQQDIRLIHTPRHVEAIKRSRQLFEIACLAAGGAIMAAEAAVRGEPAFGLIRPPGHHASPDSCWGFCYFNNMAIAIQRLLQSGQVKKALILDFDLHFGDGTENSFHGVPGAVYFHPEASRREDFLDSVEKKLAGSQGFDLIAASAGFDRHEDDWGGLLTTEDYRAIGSYMKKYAQMFCQGRRFGLLEGGYNHTVLGRNVRAFLEGMN